MKHQQGVASKILLVETCFEYKAPKKVPLAFVPARILHRHVVSKIIDPAQLPWNHRKTNLLLEGLEDTAASSPSG